MSAVPVSFQLNISRFFQSPFSVALARLAPLPLFRYYCYILGLSYLTVRTDHRRQVAAGVRTNLAGTRTAAHNDYLLWRTYLGIFEHYFEKVE